MLCEHELPARVPFVEDVTVTGSTVDMYSPYPVLEFQPVEAHPANPKNITNNVVNFFMNEFHVIFYFGVSTSVEKT